MASWQSYTHSVELPGGGLRTFTVLEHTTDQVVVNGVMTGTSQQWRTVQDAVSGEVVREFKPPPNTYGLQPYDADEGLAWLEERYGKKKHGMANVGSIAQVGQQDMAGFTCTDVRFDTVGNSPGLATWVKHEGFKKTTQTRYGSYVQSTETVDETPQSYFSPKVSYNYAINTNGHTVNFIKAPASAAAQAHDKEHDMAQRQDFTFPYTGTEIADSLERQAAKLDAQQTDATKVDRATLLLVYPSYDDTDLDEVIAVKQGEVERRNKKLADQAAALRKEAIPYAKAGKGSFEIDLEDIEHFGLNDDEAPVKAKRKRRSKAEIDAEKSPELVDA